MIYTNKKAVGFSNGFFISPPDIYWNVTIGSEGSYDALSSVMKSPYSAVWIDWVEEVAISQGDWICVAVCDDDLMSDDLIGLIYGRLLILF